ncbi:MAG: hypothetical protein K2M50_09655 [Treponemataceae bacterium]|nr:hypothetical protein [Treponema sp.]MDE6245902.1 hypothetical protein [Treponemataceae bacterium]
MGVKILVEISDVDMEQMVEEYEKNQSSFVHEFFKSMLETTAKKCREMEISAKRMKELNPLSL